MRRWAPPLRHSPLESALDAAPKCGGDSLVAAARAACEHDGANSGRTLVGRPLLGAVGTRRLCRWCGRRVNTGAPAGAENCWTAGNTWHPYLCEGNAEGPGTIPLGVRRALGITTGSDVEFVLDDEGARLLVDREHAAIEIARIRGAGDVERSTEDILALTRG